MPRSSAEQRPRGSLGPLACAATRFLSEDHLRVRDTLFQQGEAAAKKPKHAFKLTRTIWGSLFTPPAPPSPHPVAGKARRRAPHLAQASPPLGRLIFYRRGDAH